MCYDYGMVRRSAALAVTPEDKAKLERLVRSGKREQRVAFRSRIVLKAAEGIDGLYNDRPRGKAFAALPKDTEAAVIERTLNEKPNAATHWPSAALASTSHATLSFI